LILPQERAAFTGRPFFVPFREHRLISKFRRKGNNNFPNAQKKSGATFPGPAAIPKMKKNHASFLFGW